MLSTLANATVIGVDFDETVDTRVLILSMEATWALQNNTAGEGPIVVGVAHGDYTDAEVQEVLVTTGSWKEGSLVNQEIARRKVRIVGMFNGEANDQVLNDGKPIKTTMKWILVNGETLRLFAYNRASATLTTGGVVILQGHLWIKPL